MTRAFSERGAAETCPKRLWVLTSLSDDESLGDGGAVPPGLQFHLSRCPECRAVADELLAVSSGLRRLAAAEPSSDLMERAAAAPIVASSSFSLDDELPAAWPPRSPTRHLWRTALRRMVPYVAAAVLALSVLVPAVRQVGSGKPTATVEPIRRVASRRQPAVVTVDPVPERPAVMKGPPPVDPPSRPMVFPSEPVVEAPGRRQKTHIRPLPICQLEDFSEAALINDMNCVHRAIVLPSRRRPDR